MNLYYFVEVQKKVLEVFILSFLILFTFIYSSSKKQDIEISVKPLFDMYKSYAVLGADLKSEKPRAITKNLQVPKSPIETVKVVAVKKEKKKSKTKKVFRNKVVLKKVIKRKKEKVEISNRKMFEQYGFNYDKPIIESMTALYEKVSGKIDYNLWPSETLKVVQIASTEKKEPIKDEVVPELEITDEVRVTQAQVEENVPELEIVTEKVPVVTESIVATQKPNVVKNSKILDDILASSNPLSSQNNKVISKSVSDAISREMSSLKKSDKRVARSSYRVQGGLDVVAPKNMKRPEAMDLAVRKMNFSETSRPKKTNNSINHIFVKEAILDEGLTDKLTNFEFRPSISSIESFYDSGSGAIKIEQKLKGSSGVLRGSILKQGYYPVKIDLVMEPGEFEINIPLIEEDKLFNFLDSHKIESDSGIVLIEADSIVISTDLECEYDKKIYLNEFFKEVSFSKARKYILYLGVPTGSTVLHFDIGKKHIPQKIIYVNRGELYFESNFFHDSKIGEYTLFEQRLLGTKTELDIRGDDFLYFNTKIEAKHQGINNYEIFVPEVPAGFRNYFELSHLENVIVVGSMGKSAIDLPSNDFVDYIFENFKINDLDNSLCMVQVNFSNLVDRFEIESETVDNNMNMEIIYLDSDGIFSDEVSELTKKVFILGDKSGLLNVMVEYFDGKKEFLQSYCSPKTYLLEQL